MTEEPTTAWEISRWPDGVDRTVQQIADIFSLARSTIYGHLEKASVGGRPRASQSTVDS